MKKIMGYFIFYFIAILPLPMFVFMGVRANFIWEREYESHWTLADRQSTLEAKVPHILRFIERLEKSGLKGQHNAVFLKTAENSFDENLEALKSLKMRLENVIQIDPTSMAYQEAISQITEQEMDAEELVEVMKGCWFKDQYLYFWHWCAVISFLLVIALSGYLCWLVYRITSWLKVG